MDDLRADLRSHYERSYRWQIRVEQNLLAAHCGLAFLDRAVPDTVAPLLLDRHDVPVSEDPLISYRYKWVFFFDPAPYTTGTFRNASQERRQQMADTILELYKDNGYNVITLPLFSIERRIQFILDTIGFSPSPQWASNPSSDKILWVE